MPLVTGHQVIGASSVGAFHELVVVGVRRHVQWARWLNGMGTSLNELQELLPDAPADLELRASQNIAVFGEDRFGDVKPCRLGNRKQENGALQAVR